MRRSLGILLLLTVLTACGDGSDDATGPGATASAQVTVDREHQVLLSRSDGGGAVAPTATPLPDAAAVTAFASGLGDVLAGEVVEAAADLDVPAGEELYGAVVAIGCTPPEEVAVTRSGDDVLVTARSPKEDPQVQCLVPVTTVALVLVGE